ncbi:MAG: Stf0 family sulfotransferase [Acidimicrobiia bacterium]|nr:Stf0 family sulfotransferase [Acidimicrobiia bacterium]MDH5293728.1 Stf0 family sulfotransferase [Acidimicrobiia bacterium]
MASVAPVTTDRPPSQLLGPEHDNPNPVPVTRSYLLCTTPRSGSNLLCDALTQTQLLGTPTEYLEFGIATPYLARRWGTSNLLDFMETLRRHRVGPNGVFGMKIHWHQLKALTESLALGGKPMRDLPVRQIGLVLEAIAPDAHLIRLSRSDMLSQSISLFKASGTQQWSSYMEKRGGPPEYSYDELLKCYLSIAWSERLWTRLFDRLGRPVLWFDYEDVTKRRQEVVDRIAETVGIGHAAPPLAAPTLHKQSDGWNADTKARFVADLEARDIDLETLVPSV